MVSLRKKKKATQDSFSTTEKPLRHSLSLPDLASPLIDASSWEEIPALITSNLPSLPNSRSLTTTSKSPTSQASPAHDDHSTSAFRHRSPSLVNSGIPGSPVAFHRPFTSNTANTAGNGNNNWQFVQNDPKNLDFRISRSGWTNRQSIVSNAPSGSQYGHGDGHGRYSTGEILGVRRRKGRGKGRVAENLNVMVVGGKSVGKTSFINLLKDSLSLEQSEHHLKSQNEEIDLKSTPNSPTAPGPPVTNHKLSSLNPLFVPRPTLKFSSSSITVDRPDEKILLRLIDTPGLAIASDDAIPLNARQRERGVTALLRVAEEGFQDVLREENKVIRKPVSVGSSLVHLCIYLIDARSVLSKPRGEQEEEADWSCVNLFKEDEVSSSKEPANEGLEPRLGQTEIDIIRRLSERMNVLPILCQIDSLSTDQLLAVKKAVREQLGGVFVNDDGKEFGLFGMMDEEDDIKSSSIPPSPESPRSKQRASKAMSMNSKGGYDEMPYSVFSPPTRSNGSSEDKQLVRRFAWGVGDPLNSAHSDLVAFRESLLDIHAKSLRATTREILYERYRTEQLLAKRSRQTVGSEGSGEIV